MGEWDGRDGHGWQQPVPVLWRWHQQQPWLCGTVQDHSVQSMNKKNLRGNRKQEVTVVSEQASHRQLFFNLCNIQVLLILCVGACVLVYVFLSLRHSAVSEQLLKSSWG